MKIVITGASKGIGKAIAARFAQDGHHLMLCSRGEKSLYDSVEDLQTRFPNATIIARPTDMSVKSEVLSFAEWCSDVCSSDLCL